MDPAPEYGRRRTQRGPVEAHPPVGEAAWLVTRYDDARAVLGDVRSSSDTTAEVEETMRFHTVTQGGIGRAATAGIDAGGTVVRAGEGVIVRLPAANRDPSVFAEPDRFDVHRQVRDHLTLGHGVHHCTGQGLAGLELRVARGERRPAACPR
ncbi:cytochrome P450 [Wenjunlia tyrosinilytica]|uniref:Cytochrome P450 n=1 Tax=Wenjunlia tyrosinilytica TaxID=1544741 RepID=A0A917ZZ26_9ACTN|nr:cytochrome P450 [Wenjunlia tyrosinilytica]GGO99497.1 hypothetical protein GCM10012280_66070 [Wenjunlia tyrosinilytica]